MAHPDEITLHVRSLSRHCSGETVGAIVEQLDDIGNDADAAETRIEVWGEAIGLGDVARETRRGRQILSTVADCREWATSADVSLEPFFQRRAGESLVTGQSRERLALPVRVLVERTKGTVTHVTPHVDDGTTVTVRDRLARLADRETNGVTRALP